VKLTKTHLKQIIKEELQKLLLEQASPAEEAINCLVNHYGGKFSEDPKKARVVAERKLYTMGRGAAEGVIRTYNLCKRQLCTYKYGSSRNNWPRGPCRER
tara:strand:+ start:344 stop:643 length:300 start_codon:yes stop_codon:yes gene_type:complete